MTDMDFQVGNDSYRASSSVVNHVFNCAHPHFSAVYPSHLSYASSTVAPVNAGPQQLAGWAGPSVLALA